MTTRLIGAVEAGGTKFVAALARADGTILARTRIATTVPATVWPALAAFFREATAEHGAIAAFGVASFGPIDIDPASPAYGTFTTTPKPAWSGARWHDALGMFGAPIVLDTDVNGAALAESALGCGAGLDQTKATLAYTTVGTGIGTGVVRAGMPIGGFSHYESGHIPVPHDRAADPFPGICPVHGDCAEGLAAGPAILARWGRSLDRLGEAEIALVAGYLAALAATLVLLHMPDRLVFGGGVMKAPGLLEALRTATAARLAGYIAAPQLDPGLKRYIAAPALGDEAGITGAILLGRRAL